jgi:hypothetical protein
MNNLLKKNILNLFILIFIISLGHLSYVHNALKVTSDEWFEVHQIDSEQLVLDGFLNLLKNKNSSGLGAYLRNTSDEKDYLNARDYYQSESISNNFKTYNSNFGLQIYFLKFLKLIGFDKLYYYHSITALLMSAVVALLFFGIKKNFSFISAIVVALIFLLSPWIVVSARNLYLLIFIYFLPVALSMYFSNKIFMNNKQFYVFLILLFFAVLFKLLCGYEFINVIFFSTCAPLLFYSYNQNYNKQIILKKFIAVIIIFVLAFLIAATIHTMSIKNKSEKFYEPIIKIASKRLWTNKKNVNEVLTNAEREYCDNNKKCEETIYKSLTSNSAIVISKYFLMVDFLPWFYLNVSKDDRRLIIDNFKFLNDNFSFENIKLSYKNLSLIKSQSILLLFMIYFFSLITFLSFQVYSLYIFIIAKKSIKYFLALSFLGPISWYFIFKGHSAIHYHLNFILWYLFFIPASFIAIINNLELRRSKK